MPKPEYIIDDYKVRVADPAEYDGNIVVEWIPCDGVPEWAEFGLADLQGPFKSLDEAHATCARLEADFAS